MPLTTWRRVWRGIVNYCRRNNEPHNRFMGDKCAAAINVLALAVTFLRAISNLKAAPGVRRMSTLWAIHHFLFSATIKISIMIHKESILRTYLFHF